MLPLPPGLMLPPPSGPVLPLPPGLMLPPSACDLVLEAWATHHPQKPLVAEQDPAADPAGGSEAPGIQIARNLAIRWLASAIPTGRHASPPATNRNLRSFWGCSAGTTLDYSDCEEHPVQAATLPRVNHAYRAAIALRYPVVTRLEDWVLTEGTVPESAVHDAAAHRLRLVLEAWVTHHPQKRLVAEQDTAADPAGGSEAPGIQIARNLAVRWLASAPQVGIDPDVCVLSPPPPEGPLVESLCLWKPGHHPPLLCFEVVSKNHPHKDYVGVHERYAAMGTFELVVFDPLLAGPKALGGPVALQLWRRDETGIFERLHFGPGPAYSEVLGAWFLPAGHHLDIASDREGKHRWRTNEELAVAAKERECAAKELALAEKERECAERERERAARLEAERRLAELEKRLG